MIAWVSSLVLALAAVICLLLPAVNARTDAPPVNIIGYKLKTAQSHNDFDWAKFIANVCTNGEMPSARYLYTPNKFSSTKFWAPFFSKNTTQWFISSSGFLSPTEQSMCNGFCEEQSMSTLFGYYQFSTNVSFLMDGGGDWPMIGFYVADLDPGASASSMVCYIVDDETGTLTVEYNNVRFRDSPVSARGLTAQVSIEPNGIIIMRYKTLPTSAPSDVVSPPTTGLILSRNQRMIVQTPTVKNDIVAHRFEPVVDECGSNADKNSCLEDPFGCAWCRARSLCLATKTIDYTCPQGEYEHSDEPEAEGNVQRFYNVLIDNDADMVNISSKFIGGDVQVYTNLSPNTIGMSLYLGFDFPFYTSAKEPTRTFSRLVLLNPAMLAVSASQDCNPIWRTCPNGNYSMAITAFQSAVTWGEGSIVMTLRLPDRINGEMGCLQPDGCPAAFVVQVQSLFPMWGSTVGKTERVHMLEFMIDRTGVIDIRYNSALNVQEGYYAYPSPIVGLMRHGKTDPSSVVIPSELLNSNMHIRFTPSSACDDCGANGWCDEASAKCVCGDRFTGPQCSECAEASQYGPNCANTCPVCENGGVCDNGITGSGACECVAPYSGEFCEVLCSGDARCSDCNLAGGFCLCGRCVCKSGWSGPSCSEQAGDPCVPSSFDGCPVCDQTQGCTFCFDNVCFSPELSGTAIGYPCSRSYVSTDYLLCVPASPPTESPATDLGYVTLAFMLIAFCILLVLFCLIIFNTVKRHKIIDYHSLVATGGTPDYVPPRREREVVQGTFIPSSKVRRGQYVMALPLRQISLKKLYEHQRGIDEKKEE